MMTAWTKGFHCPLEGAQQIVRTSLFDLPVLREPFHDFGPNISTFLHKRGKKQNMPNSSKFT